MSYWRFEWLGWEHYKAHLARVVRAIYKDELRPLKALLGAISSAIGVWFLLPDEVFKNPGFGLLREWLPEDALGASFLLQGIGMWWRICAPSRVPLWTYFFAALGITLYVAYPLAVTLDLGRITGLAIVMWILAGAHAWCARRVGNGVDRSGP